MDAVEFLRGKDRMCRSFNLVCETKEGFTTLCEMRAKADEADETCGEYIKEHPAEAVEIVERWVKAHPKKTRQSELLKMFPRASMTADGIIAFCPDSMDSEFECPRKTRDNIDPICGECRRKYWLEEVEDNDQSND